MAKIKFIQKKYVSIEELIKGCKQNNQQSQKLLFEKFAPLIFTTCRRYSSANYPAKDLLQDTFIKAFDKIHQFNPEKGKLQSWITRISINLALNAIREKKTTFVEINAANETNLFQPDEEVLNPDLREEEILALINDLPTGYRTIFNLFVIDGFSHKEIASNLDISISTSKSQLHKAKQLLQQQINQILKERYG